MRSGTTFFIFDTIFCCINTESFIPIQTAMRGSPTMKPAKKAQTKLPRKTVVLTPTLWEKAQLMFRLRDRTFSSYVRQLIDADRP